jgi:hypothetical protein
MPSTTVIIVFVQDWSMMVLTEVGPVVVMVVAREDVPAVGGAAAATVASVYTGGCIGYCVRRFYSSTPVQFVNSS